MQKRLSERTKLAGNHAVKTLRFQATMWMPEAWP
jgi:hypothetical protein